MEFVPDPDFLNKINKNMLNNDGKFGDKGEKLDNHQKIAQPVGEIKVDEE